MQKVMVVEDDPHIRQLVSIYLKQDGYKAILAESADDALGQLEDDEVDLAVVDVMMPGMDGFKLTEILSGDLDIPVILLTAKGQLEDKGRGFTAGAEDYIVKPFEPEELIYRVRAVLKRTQPDSHSVLTYNGVVLDRIHYEVRAHDKTFMLPVKELELFACLMETPERVVTRDYLAEAVWGDIESGAYTINTHINRLRQKLEEHRVPLEIVTIRGIGYKLEGEA